VAAGKHHHGVNGNAISLLDQGRAASDDSRGASVAVAANSAAAGADHDAYADAARPKVNGKASRKNGDASQGKTKKGSSDGDELPPISPGLEALPEDGPGFVDAVHARIDLVAVGERLLRSPDDKVVQRALEFMRDLKYQVDGEPAEEPQRIVIDVARPQRDRANAAWNESTREEQKQ
jgi:hypothetical protein